MPCFSDMYSGVTSLNDTDPSMLFPEGCRDTVFLLSVSVFVHSCVYCTVLGYSWGHFLPSRSTDSVGPNLHGSLHWSEWGGHSHGRDFCNCGFIQCEWAGIMGGVDRVGHDSEGGAWWGDYVQVRLVQGGGKKGCHAQGRWGGRCRVDASDSAPPPGGTYSWCCRAEQSRTGFWGRVAPKSGALWLSWVRYRIAFLFTNDLLSPVCRREVGEPTSRCPWVHHCSSRTGKVGGGKVHRFADECLVADVGWTESSSFRGGKHAGSVVVATLRMTGETLHS